MPHGSDDDQTDHLVTSTVDYDKDSIVLQNDLVECHIYRAFHRHQRIFQSEDHLYKMYLKPKTDKPILWSSIEKILEDAFAIIIGKLQQKYATDQDALLYFAVNQNSLVNGLRSSVHVLKENSTKGMVQNVMSTFNSFLNSNQNIELNSTFEVYFKVVSGIHVNFAGHRRKAIPLRTMVGHKGSKGNCFVRGGLLDLPTGHIHNPHMFKNECLLLCLTFQYLRLSKPNIYNYLDAFLNKRQSNQKVVAAETLNDHIDEFCYRAQVDRKGPHDLHATAKLFSEIYNCQVIVINSLDGCKPQFTTFPSPINYEQIRIYLYVKNDHVLLIDKLNTFWRHEKKMICFGCKCVFGIWNNQLYTHKCPQLNRCSACSYPLKTANTVFLPHEAIFCDSKIVTESENIHCDACDNHFNSLTCFSNHLVQCKKQLMPTKCPDCGVWVPQSLRESHVCGVLLRRCNTCFTVAAPDHECLISKRTETKQWPVVGTLSMSFKSTTTSDCQNCYEARKNQAKELNIPFNQFTKDKSFLTVTCDNHAWGCSEQSRTNAISLWKERSRFSFEHFTFVDDVLEPTLAKQNSEDAYLKHRLYTYCSHPKPYVTTPRSNKRSKVVSKSITAVKDVTFQTAEKKFFQHIVRGNLQNCTILTESDQVMLKLLEIFLTFEVEPNILQKGRQVFSLELTQFSVTFLNFSHFAPGNLEVWLKQYNVPNDYAYFPEALNHDESLASSHMISVDFDAFITFGDTLEQIEGKSKYYQSVPQPLDLKAFLLNVLIQQSDSFFRVVMAFLLQSFNLQRLLTSILDKEVDCPIHPFSDNIVSCSSLIHALCQYYYLNDYNICTVKKPYGNNPAQVSQSEYEFTSFMDFENPHLQLKTAFNHPDGQQRFGQVTADAYSSVNKTVYALFGCFYHSHDPSECLNKSLVASAAKDPNPHLAQRKREIDQLLIEQTKKLYSSQVEDFQITWECGWSSYKKCHPVKLANFWAKTGLPKTRQLIRLVPRAAVRGGFLETYKLKSLADDSNKISWIDANSLYSYIAMQCPLPLGNYKIYTFLDLKNQCVLDSDDGMFYLFGQSMECDVAMVEIVCPSDLKRPFLSYRINNEFVFLANCKKCAELKLTQPCKHSDKDRAFTSTWTVVELAYAVHNLGYSILNWLEVHHYESTDFVLKKFVQILASQKLKCSGILSDCSSQQKKVELCNLVNAAMDFTHPELRLTPLNCSNNPMLKNYLKSCLNSLYGRFALNTNNTRRIFCRSVHDIEVHTANPSTNILDFITINDNIIELVIENMSKSSSANRHSNLYFTALINARGRIFIYDLSKNLESLGSEILSIDTDSICFRHDKNLNLPIQFSPAFGHFKHCLDERFEITAFYSLGVRSYMILYKDDAGCDQYLTKIKGLSLGSHNVMDKINPTVFKEFIDSKFREEVDSIFIPQCRRQLTKQTKTFRQMISTHEFSNEIHCKRFIIPNDNNYVTYPYGYNFKNTA